MASVRSTSESGRTQFRIDKTDPRYLTLEQRSQLKGELRTLQSEIDLLVIPALGPQTDKETAMVARRDEIKKKLDDFAAMRKEVKADRREFNRLRREKAKKAEKARLQSELTAKQDAKDQEKIDRELRQLRAERIATERTTVDGVEQAGLQSHMDKVMPPAARAKGNAVNKPDPIIGEVTENVPNVTVTKSPSSKSNIDTLAGSTTTASRNLNKIFTNGSPVAIKKTFESPIVQAANNIDNADAAKVVNEVKAVTKDPFVQQAFKDIGMSEEEIKSVEDNNDNIPNYVKDMVDSLSQGDNIGAEKAFKNGLASKISTALDDRRVDVAGEWMNDKPETEEPAEVEAQPAQPEEDILGTGEGAPYTEADPFTGDQIEEPKEDESV